MEEADVLYISLNQEEIDESDECKMGMVIDYSEKGNIVEIEILDTSKSITFPNKVEYEVA